MSVRRAWRILVALLKELADESAYARHLEGSGRTHCGEEWRRFCDHRLKAKYSRAKCC